MKALFLFLSFIFTSTVWAESLTYTCSPSLGRQKNSTLIVKDTQFQIEESIIDETRHISVNGTLYVQYDFNVEDGTIDEFYGGEFKIPLLAENKKYRPRKYRNYSQFKEFNATTTTEVDGGGMWGYMVIEKDTSQDEFKAHYIFQAGDHMGGSIDFTCSR